MDLVYDPYMAKPKTVNVHEAKTQFSKLLKWVERGDEVIIAPRRHPFELGALRLLLFSLCRNGHDPKFDSRAQSRRGTCDRGKRQVFHAARLDSRD